MIPTICELKVRSPEVGVVVITDCGKAAVLLRDQGYIVVVVWEVISQNEQAGGAEYSYIIPPRAPAFDDRLSRTDGGVEVG